MEGFPDIILVAAMSDSRQIPGASSIVSLGADPSDHAADARALTAVNQLTKRNLDRPVLVYCHHASCQLSYNAALRLRQLGYRQILWMREGLQGWTKSGFKLADADQVRVPIDGDRAYFLTHGGGFERLPMSRPIRVTEAMVTAHDPGEFLGGYEAVLALQGNRGDRFRLDYRGKVPTSIEHDYDGLAFEYPEGSKIDDLSGSVTVTVTKPGVHQLSLSQIGHTYSEERKRTSQVLAPLDGKRIERAFIPFDIVVTQLN